MGYNIRMYDNGLFYLTKEVTWWIFKYNITIDTGSLESMEYEYKKLTDKKRIMFNAYEKIKKHYGRAITNRSKVPLINHIDEGLKIMEILNASQEAKDAYCLHPLLQSDEDFRNHYKDDFSGISTSAIILAVEYRRVANSYLSTGNLEDFSGFTTTDIFHMLYADKVQNEKDFKLYHEGNHPRSNELREYFNNWFVLLGIK